MSDQTCPIIGVLSATPDAPHPAGSEVAKAVERVAASLARLDGLDCGCYPAEGDLFLHDESCPHVVADEIRLVLATLTTTLERQQAVVEAADKLAYDYSALLIIAHKTDPGFLRKYLATRAALKEESE